MNYQIEGLSARLIETLAEKVVSCDTSAVGEVRLDVCSKDVLEVFSVLRDDSGFGFEELIDVAGVDYSEYDSPGEWCKSRFAVVYHLLSITNNWRLRVRVFLDDVFPVVPSVTPLWRSANWFEREAFDMFGIVFEGHPDLRRILTDYGFIGHPFRKDFPLNGYVEMIYDEEKGRVIYQPVSIENRVTVPKVSRSDHRYVRSDSEADGSV